MTQVFTTKVTYLGKGIWGCRILKDEKVFQEARVLSRQHIGPAFRDMLRMLDKCGWDCELARAARLRMRKPGNTFLSVKVLS